ncbi:hypothetical protein LCGC14_1552630, partial [marine sediment metagenome]
MDAGNKTNEQLVREVEQLRRHIDELEGSEAERALHESESRYRALFETVSDAIMVFDAEAKQFVDVNGAAVGLYGYTRDEFLALKQPDITAEPAESAADIKEVLAGRLLRVPIRYHKKKDGTVFPVEISAGTLNLGSRTLLCCVIRDITERNREEEVLREGDAFIRAVMDNLPIGIAVNSVDPAVEFSYMNDRFTKLYRTTREALADPDAFWDAVYEEPAFREEIKKRVLDDCASGDPERMYWEDVPITRKGHETAFITARNTPVPDKHLMISTVWDVTGRRRAEDALGESR